MNILILAAAAVVLILIIIRFYPLVYIFFTRIFFGKYNARYIQTHRRFTGKNPYGYCIKDDFINYIAGFYEKIDEIPTHKSRHSITFRDIPFETTFRKVRKHEGRFFCLNASRLGHFDLKVLGFRENMFSHEVKTYYFFVNNLFFMGDYSFKETDQLNVNELAQILSKKYLENINLDSDDFLIEGANNVLIRFSSSGFHLSIKYLYKGNEHLNTLLDQFWAMMKTKKIETSTTFEEELLKKL